MGASFLDSQYLNPDYLFEKMIAFFSDVGHFLFRAQTLSGFYAFLSILAIIFLIFLAYAAVRMMEIRQKEHHHLEHEKKEYAHHLAEHEKKIMTGDGGQKNERWNNVLTHIFSTSESDWKLAIIEADSMLDVLMSDLGYKGESLGEKLKSVDREKFRNLTAAWEVHTIRNNIAHQGMGYGISQHEAKRVIAIYEQIFREFGYI